jgi:hypothetical protein
MVPTPMYMSYLLPMGLREPHSRRGRRSIVIYGSVPERAIRRNSRALGRWLRASVSWS